MSKPSFIFSSERLELKAEGRDFYVEGYISTSDLDLVNDIVTKTCLMDMAQQMKTRVIKFDVEHECFKGDTKLEREINKTLIPVAKVDDFIMDKKGLKVRAKLNRFANRFDEVKGSIEEGFLDAFSIAFVPVEQKTEIRNGKEARLLNKVNLLNVAFTGNPINTESKMTNVFTKSLEALNKGGPGKLPSELPKKLPKKKDEEEDEKPKKKTYKKNNHGNDTIKLQEVKYMTEEEKETIEAEASEEKVEEVVEETKDEEPLPVETEEPKTEEVVEENAEVKALSERVDGLTKELAEVKAKLKAPVRKAVVEQVDKSDNFVQEKSQNPLDLIA